MYNLCMLKIKNSFIQILSIFLLVSCAPNPAIPLSEIPTTTQNVPEIAQTNTVVADTPTSLPPTLTEKRTQYDFNVTLDYYSHNVAVEQKVYYVNNSGQTIGDISLLIYPALFPNSFSLQSLFLDGNQVTNYSFSNKRIQFALPRALLPGESAEVGINYSLNLPQREGTYGYTSRQMNLANWFPMIPPYREGSGWVEYNPWVVKDFLVGEFNVYDSSDFKLNLKTINSSVSLKVAAPAIPVVNGESSVYEIKGARTFAFSLSDQYLVSSKVFNGITVNSYYYQEDQFGGQEVVDIVGRAVEHFSTIFGAYPFNTLNIVEADFLHGMEFDGLFFLSNGFYGFYDGTAQNNLTIISAHETAHQWFFSLVGDDQASHPWLDEALCTFSESLYYEKYHPELVNWWWSNRIEFFKPEGVVNGDIYSYPSYEAYRDAVYLRGALFLRDLRVAAGDEKFFEFLKEYVKKNSYRIAGEKDFLDLYQNITGVDYTKYVEAYFKE